jgi:cytidine deaminase
VLDSAAVIDWEALLERARAARENAYAPYSEYRVGAALLTAGGEVYTGANVEHGIPALAVCAERVAAVTAAAAGRRRFAALAVVTTSSPPAFPCGLCRQTLAEFVAAGEDLPILAANLAGERAETTFAALLPHPFRLGDARAAKPR